MNYKPFKDEMKFTDDDLKRLKEECHELSPVWSVTPELIIDLLSRLEAAEDLCRHVYGYPAGDVHRDRYEKAWRKAKGE